MSNTKSQHGQISHRLIASSGIVALGVMTSRFLGFLRDMVIAHFMGTGWMADAFFVAQRIPNLLRDLVGEGAANAAIVPVLSEYQHKKTEQYASLINSVMLWAVGILGCLTLLGMWAAPIIVQMMAPGFLDDQAKFELTVNLTRIIFPYLILIGLTALQVGILYSQGHFFSASFSSSLMNVAMIIGVWIAAWINWSMAYALAVAVVVGGVGQLVWQWFSLHQKNIKINIAQMRWNHPGVRKIGKLLLPRIWGSAVYQLNIFADTFCASLVSVVGSGGISAIYYANRLVQFPLGVFAYALSSVTLPTLSSLVAHGQKDTFRQVVLEAIKNLLFILIPLAIIIGVMADDLVKLIFERGAFDAYSRQTTVLALTFFIIGLPFYGITRILVMAFYALQDTRTPVRIATICLLINVAGNLILMFPMKIGGIALASSLSSIVNVILLVHGLNQQVHRIEKDIFAFLRRLLMAVFAMGLVLWAMMVMVQGWLWVKVILTITVSLAIYGLVSVWSSVSQANNLIALIRRKL